MKRSLRIAALLLAFLLCLPLLAACHGRTGLQPFSMPESFDESRSYEITFWAKNDTNSTQVQIYHDAIAGFEALYPNIKVNLKLYTDYGKIYNDVITNIATQTTPNVCITYPDHIATYKTGVNTVVSLDSLMTDAAYGLGGSAVKFDAPTQEEIVPKFLSECEIDGSCYALPFMRSTEACYVNRSYVEALGYTLPEVLTWDFIFEVSEAAMKKNADGTFAINGQKVMIPFIYKSTDNMMITYLKQADAGYSTDAGAIELFNDTTAELLGEVAAHAGDGTFSTFKISSYPGNFLNRGQCIFAIDSTAGATWMGSDAPLIDVPEEELVEFELEVMTIPQLDPETPQMISQGPSVCVFNKSDPQEVLASWLFTQYLLTDSVQISYSQTEGYVPVTSKAQASAEYLDYLSRGGEDSDFYYEVKIKAAKLLLENTDNTFVTPVFNGSASLRNAAGQLVEEAAKAARRGTTVDKDYIETLYEKVSSLYRLDQITEADSTALGLQQLGNLPPVALLLLSALGGAWLAIGSYFAVHVIKKRKK